MKTGSPNTVCNLLRSHVRVDPNEELSLIVTIRFTPSTHFLNRNNFGKTSDNEYISKNTVKISKHSGNILCNTMLLLDYSRYKSVILYLQ